MTTQHTHGPGSPAGKSRRAPNGVTRPQGSDRPGRPDRPENADSSRTTRPRGERGPLASAGLHLALLLASVIAVGPPLWLLVTSFKPGSEAFSTSLVKEFTFENYEHVLTETAFLTWLGNSLIVVGLTTVLGVFISATTGYAVSRFRFPGMRSLMWLLLVTQMFPVAVLIVPLYNLLAKFQLLNQPAGLVLTYLTIAVPFSAWMMKGYFDTVPVEIDEAGRVDGLNPFGIFWRLILPLARPGLAVTGFYSFITGWAEVAYASAFMTGEDNLTLSGGMQTFVSQYTSDWGSLTAGAVIVAVPAAVVFGFAQRHLVAGLTAGATKS